jgi:uncharacterized protein YdeI (YjbR/CyaY-like superfamily)
VARSAHPAPELPTLAFASQSEWTAWLDAHSASSRGIWLKIAKVGSGVEGVSYAQALETALCYGWIDGQKAPYDQHFWLQRFTPRGPRSAWSRINRDKATALLEQGRMQPSGRLQIEQAQQDGRWQAAYEGQRQATVPDDLQAALDEHPRAQEFFSTLDRGNRYAILYRIQDAKQPATRARRIQQYVEMLDQRQTIHPRTRKADSEQT